MTLQEFIDSTTRTSPPANLSNVLQGLWYDQKGDWHKAHDLVDGASDEGAAWVHAYLHRKEGDVWNADYWYRRAGRSRPDVSLQDEWKELVQFFISR